MPDAQIRARIRDHLGKTIRNVDLNDDDDIFENGFVNSLFAVELVAFAENTFGITIEDDDLDLKNFNSVSALTRFVESKVAG